MKTRVLSAIVLIAILVPLLIIGGLPFSIALAVIATLSFKEITDLKKKEKDLPSLIKICGLLCLLLLSFAPVIKDITNASISFGYIAIVVCVYLIPTIFYGVSNRYTTKDAFYLIGWTILLGLFYNAVLSLVNNNLTQLIYLVLITTLNDTFALIFGKLIGTHKLTAISPNKTIEGSLCGLILGTFVAVMFYIHIINPAVSLLKVIIMTGVLSIVGQCGDLIFSKIKRENKIKDFSKLIPGHGGILDRFDSLSLVVLTYLIILSFI